MPLPPGPVDPPRHRQPRRLHLPRQPTCWPTRSASAREREPRVYTRRPATRGSSSSRSCSRCPTASPTPPPTQLPRRPAPACSTPAPSPRCRQFAADAERRRTTSSVNGFVDELKQHARAGRHVRDAADRAARRRAQRGPRSPAGRSGSTGAQPSTIDRRSHLRRRATRRSRSRVWRARGRELRRSSLQPKIVDADAQRASSRRTCSTKPPPPRRRTAPPASSPRRRARSTYPANQPLVPKRRDRRPDDWQLLRAENEAYRRRRWTGAGVEAASSGWRGIVADRHGRALRRTSRKFQPQDRPQPRRAASRSRRCCCRCCCWRSSPASATSPLYLFGIAPTILVAMILTIALRPALRDRRRQHARGARHRRARPGRRRSSSILWVGRADVLLPARRHPHAQQADRGRRRRRAGDDGRDRRRRAAVARPAGRSSCSNCLYTGAAGLAVGFVVLGILPFIEKAFRITTSMTLLELADAQPAAAAPARDRGARARTTTACRSPRSPRPPPRRSAPTRCSAASAAYYHDVGKINKADYFIENQTDGENRHINLTPSVSLLIIIGHVKDGVELAKEYNLPTQHLPVHPAAPRHDAGRVLLPPGRARSRTQREPDGPAISETQYRYPGPKPRSKEIAIVMIADAVESATRAMAEPTASRIEALVHDLAMKRLLDGQFDECDLTMRELRADRALAGEDAAGIYHGRIAYPSTRDDSSGAAATRRAPTAAPREPRRREPRELRRDASPRRKPVARCVPLPCSATSRRARSSLVHATAAAAHAMLRPPLRELSVALVGDARMSDAARAVHGHPRPHRRADVPARRRRARARDVRRGRRLRSRSARRQAKRRSIPRGTSCCSTPCTACCTCAATTIEPHRGFRTMHRTEDDDPDATGRRPGVRRQRTRHRRRRQPARRRSGAVAMSHLPRHRRRRWRALAVAVLLHAHLLAARLLARAPRRQRWTSAASSTTSSRPSSTPATSSSSPPSAGCSPTSSILHRRAAPAAAARATRVGCSTCWRCSITGVITLFCLRRDPARARRHAGERDHRARPSASCTALRLALLPVTKLMHVIDRARRPRRRQRRRPQPEQIEQEIEQEILSAVEEGEKEGVVDEEERRDDRVGHRSSATRTAGQIMTAAPGDRRRSTLGATLDAGQARSLEESGHSRLPVYEGTLDHIVGILYARDLLTLPRRAAGRSSTSAACMRPPFFVPETKPLRDLLHDFRAAEGPHRDRARRVRRHRRAGHDRGHPRRARRRHQRRARAARAGDVQAARRQRRRGRRADLHRRAEPPDGPEPPRRRRLRHARRLRLHHARPHPRRPARRSSTTASSSRSSTPSRRR